MSSKRRLEDYALYLVIGSLYAFAVNLSILTTTILSVSPLTLYLLGLGALILFALIFWNQYTTLATIGLVLFTALILFWVRDAEVMEGFWYFINELILLIRGYLAFRPEFNWPLLIGITLLTGLFIAVCLYVNFHFYMLACFGASIFVICWLMDYPQSLLGFIIYLFCFCVLLVRKLQGPAKDSTKAALIAAPLCALVVWAAISVPVPTASLDDDAINRLFNEPWEVVSEFFFLAFNPKYFSFQTTGFGGQGGRLGGPVSPNHRPVMAVESPRRVYLSGVTHNIYTGYGWRSDFNTFTPAEGRIHPSYIEFMETAHALFRETSRAELTGQLTGQMRFVSHLPLSNVDVFVGNNRTGSLFRPMRDRGILFDNTALNDMLLVNDAGDRRLRELIPRHSAYRYSFLDLDYREEHIQNILRASRRGIYRERLENPSPLVFDIWDENGSEIVGQITLAEFQPRVGQLVADGGATVIVDTAEGQLLGYITDIEEGDEEVVQQTILQVMREISPGMHQVIVTIDDRDMSFHRFNRYNLTSEWYGLEGFDRLIDSYVFLEYGEVELFYRFSAESAADMIIMKLGVGQDAILAEYADFVYLNYTALPYTLPQRVIDLAHEITRYYYTDYDRVRALQEFLIQFPYTLTPAPVPRDRDFVDYFLFDGQEGYCVYYASAMVVMTRAIGIPARYAEGFLLPGQRDQETGLFTVTNRNAHAWAEVYFEGFGWLIVETTAPYVYAMYERPFFAIGDLFAGDFAGWGWDYEEYLRMMGLWYTMYGMHADWDFAGVLTDIAGGEDTAAPEHVPINLWVVAIAAAIAAVSLVVLYFISWHVLWALRLNKVKHMNTRDKAVYYYREILRIADYWRYPFHEGETPYLYGQRLRYRFAFVNDTIFLRDLNEIYYRARYGEKAPTEKEADFMKDCYYELVNYVKIVRGRPKFLYIRYIKSVIVL